MPRINEESNVSSSTGFRSVHSGVRAGRTGAVFEYLMAVRSEEQPYWRQKGQRGAPSMRIHGANDLMPHLPLSLNYFVYVFPTMQI